MDRPLYPFTAVVGQERAKQALLCLAVEPRIGGVLLCGEKGTAKSTLVRALGGLEGVRLLELPVSATEDMLLGGVELEAAVRTGCGLVSLGVPETIWPVEAAKCVSAMPFPLPDKHGRLSPKAKEEILERAAGCDAVALGPGLGRGDGVTELVLDLLQKIQQPMVLDADGINALGGHIDVLDARRDRITVLTPHDGEFARIGGDLTGSNRLGAARAFGAAHGCVLVLKGHRTLTAAPAGNVLVNTTGNSGLAKGGSGDVLTGIVAALLAQGATAVRAAAVGVWLHGRAGDLAAERLTPYGMTPEDVVSSLPAAIGEIL